MSLEKAEAYELIDRHKTLVLDYKRIAPELAKKLEEFGRLRRELQLITVEFNKRKINIEELDKNIENGE